MTARTKQDETRQPHKMSPDAFELRAHDETAPDATLTPSTRGTRGSACEHPRAFATAGTAPPTEPWDRLPQSHVWCPDCLTVVE